MIVVREWTVWKRRVLGFIWRFKSKESKRWDLAISFTKIGSFEIRVERHCFGEFRDGSA